VGAERPAAGDFDADRGAAGVAGRIGEDPPTGPAKRCDWGGAASTTRDTVDGSSAARQR
jgi:hypothetical protein